MHPLAVLGTSSDAGKTTLVMALCRIFADRGVCVAPFKAQNVSNNSAVAEEGGEIARAQCLQAEAARVPASVHCNPVLLKSWGASAVQVIVQGQLRVNQSIAAYYQTIPELKNVVAASFRRLQARHELIIAEGAGSPVELNLLHKDLSNTFIAQTFETRNILVADIERGGVFASIYGTQALLSATMRKNLLGVVINKFRGDRRFFDEGERIVRERFGLPVLGVLPYHSINIDMEDSQSLQNYVQRSDRACLRVAVLAYPGMSNYNDLDVLMADPQLHIELLRSFSPLQGYDMVLLPGSKTVFRDLAWLRSLGFEVELKRFRGAVFGICGGYHMLCQKLCDPQALEHDSPTEQAGLGFIADTVHYAMPKIVRRGHYALFNIEAVAGYEIHLGRVTQHALCYHQLFETGPGGSGPRRVAGTHVHGVFDSNALRQWWFGALHPDYQAFDYLRYRNAAIDDFAAMVAQNMDVDALMLALQRV